MNEEMGILLPESILRSRWFLILAAFVAFNTIVFVGLSIGRVFYWPRPLAAREARRLIEHAGLRRDTGGDGDDDDGPMARRPTR